MHKRGIEHDRISESQAKGNIQTQFVYPVTESFGWLFYGEVGHGAAPGFRVYAPYVEPGLLQAFANVETPGQVKEFVGYFGDLGWAQYVKRGYVSAPPEDDATFARVMQRMLRQRATGVFAEPVRWILEQAALVRWARLAWHLQPKGPDAPPLAIDRVPVECPDAGLREVHNVMTALDVILRRNTAGVTFRPYVIGSRIQVGIRGECLADALWSLVAQECAGGAPTQVCLHCRKVFRPTDKRQEYCHPRWRAPGSTADPFYRDGRKRRSLCYEAARQRDRRAGLREQGLTSRGDTPQRHVRPRVQRAD